MVDEVNIVSSGKSEFLFKFMLNFFLILIVLGLNSLVFLIKLLLLDNKEVNKQPLTSFGLILYET